MTGRAEQRELVEAVPAADEDVVAPAADEDVVAVEGEHRLPPHISTQLRRGDPKSVA
jgi:hypothetical protein